MMWELKHEYLEGESDGAGGAGNAAPQAPAGTAPAAAPDPGAEGAGGVQPGTSPQGAGEAAAPSDAAPPRHWKELLSEDLRGAPALKDIDSVDGLAQQLVNAQGLIGNSLRIPSENASDEDRAAFRAKLRESVPGLVELSTDPDAFASTMRNFGTPESADEYQLPQFEGEFEPVAGFNEWAHEANMTQAQFETLATRFTESRIQAAEQSATEHNASMEALQREWGYAYEKRVELALAMAKRSGAPDEFVQAMEGNRVPASWVKYMASLGDSYGDSGLGIDRDATDHEMTPAEAQAQYDEIMRNREHAYWKSPPGSEEGQRARELTMRLKERAMGKGSRDIAATFGYGGGE